MSMLVLVASFLLISKIQCAEHRYKVLKDTGLSSITDQNKWLLKSSQQESLMLCLAQCNSHDDCLTSIYVLNRRQCFLFKKYFHSTQLVALPQSNMYIKECVEMRTRNEVSCMSKDTSLLNVFTSYQQRVRIVNYTDVFRIIAGFEIVSKSYYVANLNRNGIVIYDDKWQFQSFRALGAPAGLKLIQEELFIARDIGLLKTDMNFNILGNHSSLRFYRGIEYNQQNDTVLVGSYMYKTIEIFTRNLTLLDTIITADIPFSFAAYENKIYVGSTFRRVMVIENNVVVRNLTTVCTGTHHSLLIDDFGYMAIACQGHNMTYLYHTNGTYMNKNISTPHFPTTLRIDSRGRLVINSYFEINIYY